MKIRSKIEREAVLEPRTALTAHTGSLSSPTRKVMSQSSGRWARKPRSLHSPDSS